jgi:tripartite-type tricarboxylate transporter receptor subunit TctC
MRPSLMLISAFGLAFLPHAHAETWPTRTITAIIPFAAGSFTDVAPRVVFEQLSKQLGQSIIVENRPGAGTTTAAAFVAKSDPDGYTILVNSSAHTIAPALYPKLSYNPLRDFAGVLPLGIASSVLVVPPSSGFKTAAEFVAAAKAKPGAMNFATPGVGTGLHLSTLRFQSSAGIQAVPVMFKGGQESMAEVIAGRIDFFFAPVGIALPHVKGGTLTALAVNGFKRSAALPEVPTTAEAGFTNAEYPFWFGIFLPAKTPRNILEKLYSESVKALANPTVRDKLLALGVDPMQMTSTEFDAHVEKQIAADAALVKEAGIKTH